MPGSSAKRRNMHYEILGDPIFRERDVPRMLALATARADGDASVPDELKNYPARSRAGQKRCAWRSSVTTFTADVGAADRRRRRFATAS